MNIPIVSLSILDPLYSLFGSIIKFIYTIFGNYGLAVIIFTILIRLVLLPFYVKQHKSSLQQQALAPQLADLQKYYGNDREGYTTAQMELYNKHGVSIMGGCLPMLLSIIIMWPVYRIIQGPMHFIMGVPVDNLNSIGQILLDKGLATQANMQMNLAHNNIFIVDALNNNPQVLSEVVNNGLVSVGSILNMNFLGLNLGLKPSLNPSLLFGAQSSTFLPLLLFPLAATGFSLLQSIYTQRITSPDAKLSRKEKKELKEKQAKNPALQQSSNTDPAATTNKSMMIMMPMMTLLFTFMMPAAMSLYWIVGSLLGMFQTWLFYKIYSAPMAERQAASDAEYEAKIKARAEKEKEAISRLQDEAGRKKKRRRKED